MWKGSQTSHPQIKGNRRPPVIETVVEDERDDTPERYQAGQVVIQEYTLSTSESGLYSVSFLYLACDSVEKVFVLCKLIYVDFICFSI